ncbi:hypothetical protein BC828DRAFT_419440 [Blastocladiella britannica]|nr:hypothetical protein BC828DRAFT_419440 [Blastocladiella britannica]
MAQTQLKRIVVLGGGPAGVQTFQSLCTLLAKSPVKTSLTLVSNAEAHFNNIAVPRVIASPQIPPTKLLRPLKQMFTGSNGSDQRLVIASVTSVDEKKVHIDAGDSIDYDYLVVALGSRYTLPFKGLAGPGSETAEALYKVAAQITQSDRILVLGMGIVAVETAAEIKSAYPNKTVTVAGPKLLAQAPEAFVARVRSILATLGVEVVENVRGDTAALLASTGAASYPIVHPGGVSVALTSTTDSSQSAASVTADMVFASTGITPNSEPLKSSVWPLTTRGFLRTSRGMQVVGHDNVFAVGDIAETEPVSPFAGKLAYLAAQQAPIAAKNLAAVVEGKAATAQWTPPADFMTFGAFGPKHGAAYLPGIKMGMGLTSFIAKQVKGRDGGLGMVTYLKETMYL